MSKFTIEMHRENMRRKLEQSRNQGSGSSLLQALKESAAKRSKVTQSEVIRK